MQRDESLRHVVHWAIVQTTRIVGKEHSALTKFRQYALDRSSFKRARDFANRSQSRPRLATNPSSTMLRIALLSLISILASGCASNLLKPDGVSQASLTADSGILIGSFARNPDAPSYYSQTFFFKSVKTSKVHEIKSQQSFNIFSGKTRDDFDTDTSAGGVFAFSLPAGQYVFHNFRLYQARGMYAQNWGSKQDYAIPFEVVPNATSYVGEIKLDPMTGKNIFGMSVQAGGVWLISDQRVRDVALLKKLRPEVSMTNVVSVIPERKDVFTPLVILPLEAEQVRSTP